MGSINLIVLFQAMSNFFLMMWPYAQVTPIKFVSNVIVTNRNDGKKIWSRCSWISQISPFLLVTFSLNSLSIHKHYTHPPSISPTIRYFIHLLFLTRCLSQSLYLLKQEVDVPSLPLLFLPLHPSISPVRCVLLLSKQGDQPCQG